MNSKLPQFSLWRSIAVALLLGGYLSAFVMNELHHLLEHHHSHEHCSTETESDPCHRLVFHNDSKAECEHEGHIHAPKHECDLCDVVLAQSNIPQLKSFPIPSIKKMKFVHLFNEDIILRFSFPSISLRGPPAYS